MPAGNPGPGPALPLTGSPASPAQAPPPYLPPSSPRGVPANTLDLVRFPPGLGGGRDPLFKALRVHRGPGAASPGPFSARLGWHVGVQGIRGLASPFDFLLPGRAYRISGGGGREGRGRLAGRETPAPRCNVLAQWAQAYTPSSLPTPRGWGLASISSLAAPSLHSEMTRGTRFGGGQAPQGSGEMSEL